MNDWRVKAVEDFCCANKATIIVEDEWKTKEKKVTLRRGDYVVVRRIGYNALLTLLPTIVLNEMINEILTKEGK